jgi:hypothetical protein
MNDVGRGRYFGLTFWLMSANSAVMEELSIARIPLDFHHGAFSGLGVPYQDHPHIV